MPKILGLEVKELELVNLPLLEYDAKRLLQISTPIQHRKNDSQNTSSDIYRLDTSMIAIKNPEWSVKLKELVNYVGKALECLHQIEASEILFNLLIKQQFFISFFKF